MVLETLVKKRPQLVHPPFGLGESKLFRNTVILARPKILILPMLRKISLFAFFVLKRKMTRDGARNVPWHAPPVSNSERSLAARSLYFSLSQFKQ